MIVLHEKPTQEINKMTNSKIQLSIFQKIGYSVNYQDLELEECGIEDSDTGYFWEDTNGECTGELFETEAEAIADCLSGLNLETECSDVKLSKVEKKYLNEEYGVELS